MPSSDPYIIPHVVNKMTAIHKKCHSVLDIGIGSGKYGFFVREYMDGWNEHYSEKDWKIKLDGIEAYEPYINCYHRAIYNNIFIGDLFWMTEKIENYDLILCCDVVEHFDKVDGVSLLEFIKTHCKWAIVTTPINMCFQGAWGGNEYERHRYQWSRMELEQFGKVMQAENTFMLHWGFE